MLSARVFIAHARTDEPSATRLRHALRQAGRDTWLERVVIEQGEALPAWLECALDGPVYLLACLSATAMATGWVETLLSSAPVRRALDTRDFFCVRLESVDISHLAENAPCADLFPDDQLEAHVQALIEALDARFQARVATPPHAAGEAAVVHVHVGGDYYDVRNVSGQALSFGNAASAVVHRSATRSAARAEPDPSDDPVRDHLEVQLRGAIPAPSRIDVLALLADALGMSFAQATHDVVCRAIVEHVLHHLDEYQPVVDALVEVQASPAAHRTGTDLRRIADILLPFCWVRGQAVSSFRALLERASGLAIALNGARAEFSPRMYFSAGMRRVRLWRFATVPVEGADLPSLERAVLRAVSTALKRPGTCSLERVTRATKKLLESRDPRPVVIALDGLPGEHATRVLRERFPYVFFFIMTHGYEPPEGADEIDGIAFLRPPMDLEEEDDLAFQYENLQEML